MSDEIEIISDGDGLAVFGSPAAVERFLGSAGVKSRDLALQHRLGATLRTGSGVAQAGSEIAANAGRWVKLTEESAKAMKVGQMMKGSSSGVRRAVVTDKGKVTKLLEFAKPGSVGSMLTNPAMLAGAAGIMAQMAMQQAMDEITEYLAVIDEKVDDILRAQKDAALAEMIGVGLVIDDAMTVREHTGSVSAITWSKVQGAEQSIATTQAYALRRLDALAEKLEKKSKVGDLVKLTADAEATVEEWLAVLARCFQLQDGLAVLELDRVLHAHPEELESHQAGLRSARNKRRDLIANSTVRLIKRMDDAGGLANSQVLLHPLKSGAVVRSGNEVAADVILFNDRLGIEATRDSLEAKRWVASVNEAKNDTLGAIVDGANAVSRFGVRTFSGAKSAGDRLTQAVAERLPRRDRTDFSNDDPTSGES